MTALIFLGGFILLLVCASLFGKFSKDRDNEMRRQFK